MKTLLKIPDISLQRIIGILNLISFDNQSPTIQFEAALVVARLCNIDVTKKIKIEVINLPSAETNVKAEFQIISQHLLNFPSLLLFSISSLLNIFPIPFTIYFSSQFFQFILANSPDIIGHCKILFSVFPAGILQQFYDLLLFENSFDN